MRDQGLGKYCDPEFIRAAAHEMQEAMDMTEEEFDAAAYQLLEAEREGTLRVPIETEVSGWKGEEDPSNMSVPVLGMGPASEASSEPIAPSWKSDPNPEPEESWTSSIYNPPITPFTFTLGCSNQKYDLSWPS